MDPCTHLPHPSRSSGLYAYTVVLFVYRLRRLGERQSRADMAMEGLRGDLVVEPYADGFRGRRAHLAYLYEPGSQAELMPRLEACRVLRVREALTLIGLEAVPRGRKKVEHYRQTWVCSATPIALERWPEKPRRAPRYATGFDPADDDFA